MKIYCPFIACAWGDWICRIWAAEYIKTHLPEAEMHVNDGGLGYPLHVADSNISEWADKFIQQDPCEPADYDYVLCTYCRWPRIVNALPFYSQPYKKIYFDGYGMALKFILEDWYPSFSPTKALIKQFEKLNLPEEYDVIHYSKCCINQRNKHSFEDFLKIYQWIWKDKGNVVSTGKPIPGCIDLNKIAGFLKLYVMMKADKIYVSESGFPRIASMYRKRKKSYVIDLDISRLTSGQSVCYTNIEITGDLKPVYYYLENHPFEDYFNWCQTIGGIEENYGDKYYGSFPNFKVTKDESPLGYIPKKVYLDIENCPMPYNFVIKYNEITDGITCNQHQII